MPVSDDITRMWREINESKERVIKLESRTETMERQHQQALSHMSRAEASFNAGIEKIAANQDEFFEYMRRELEDLKKDRDTRAGLEEGKQIATEQMIKRLKIWLGIPGALVAIIGLLAFFGGNGGG